MRQGTFKKGNTPYSELRPSHYETERAGSDGEVLVAGRCCLPEVGVVEEQRAHALALPINQWHASNLNRSAHGRSWCDLIRLSPPVSGCPQGEGSLGNTPRT